MSTPSTTPAPAAVFSIPEARVAPPNPDGVTITAEDLAELAELRAERAEKRARDAADAAEAAARLTPPTHYVHLADGTVITGSQLGTHHTSGDGTGHPRADTVLRVLAAVQI